MDVLTEGWLHKAIMFFYAPAAWPAWQILGAALFGAFLVGTLWWRLLNFSPQLGMGAFLMQMGFFVLDLAVLLYLPRNNISFGPWKPQLVVLTLPRLLASLVIITIAFSFGFRPAFVLNFGIQLFASALLIYATIIEPHQLQLNEFVLFSDKLPLHTGPIKLLHITDLHIEKWTKRESNVLELAKQANPDIIIISGDYVSTSFNKDPDTYAIIHRLLSQLKAPHGVFATLGTPPVDLRDEVTAVFADLPHIKLLRQQWEVVDLGNGRRIVMMGMDCTHHLETDDARLARLMSRVPADLPKVLVYHSPEMMPQAVHYGIDLYMCGHTHGGQVRLPLLGPILTSSHLGRDYVMGLYQENKTNLYVSRGIGLEGMSAPRVRLLCPPEMTLIELLPG